MEWAQEREVVERDGSNGVDMRGIALRAGDRHDDPRATLPQSVQSGIKEHPADELLAIVVRARLHWRALEAEIPASICLFYYNNAPLLAGAIILHAYAAFSSSDPPALRALAPPARDTTAIREYRRTSSRSTAHASLLDGPRLMA